MKNQKTDPARSPKAGAAKKEPFRVRLPGFIVEENIGLGDVFKRVTYAAGFQPCRGCERRAATLNRWMVFSGNRFPK
jgi:hypothetical protein